MSLLAVTLILGIDLGTSKITAIAVDAETGGVAAAATEPATGQVTAAEDRRRGRSEWDARRLVQNGHDCLVTLARRLGERKSEVASLGVTGQQHGMLLIDEQRQPASPLINWQDQRANDEAPGDGRSWVDLARQRLGEEAIQRTGCVLNTGFMAATLFWLKAHDRLPSHHSACFLMDLFVSTLTGTRPVTDPTLGGSAGVLNVRRRAWDEDAIGALDLHPDLFPLVREADVPAGALSLDAANTLGLPVGLPVAVPIGDHQASFVGTIADREHSVLLNVGTGAQVAMFSATASFAPPIELRPYPMHGNLLSNVGLTGGWSVQVVERLVRELGVELFEADPNNAVFERLTQLAERAAPNSGGLRWVPTFSGTRSDPGQTGSLLDATPENLTAANFVHALFAGMARNYREAWDQVRSVVGAAATPVVLAGAGNGLRENRVLARAVADEFQIAPRFTRHREEAAYGAALVGGVAAEVFESLPAAGRIIQWDTTAEDWRSLAGRRFDDRQSL